MDTPNARGGRATTPSPLQSSASTYNIQHLRDPSNPPVVSRLAAMGLPTFPLQHNSKVPPRGESWLERVAIREDHDWSTGNLAVATGGGLVVLDFDNKPNTPDRNGMAVLAGWDMVDRLPRTFRVRTPSGGVHAYFRVPGGVRVANSQSKLAPGVDVRGENGYVVAPGSTIDSRAYEIECDAPVADIPDEMLPDLSPPPERITLAFDVETDTDANTARAVSYLQRHAPAAIEGHNGDLTTFKVAARVKDFGVSEGMCHALMLEHWNDLKASPPWSVEALAAKVASAYRNGSLPPGVATPEADAERLPPEDVERILDRSRTLAERAAANPARENDSGGLPDLGTATTGQGQGMSALRMPVVAPWGQRDLSEITVPEAIYPSGYTRGRIMVTAADPKVGKSALVLTECIDMACGRGLLTGNPAAPLRVLYVNLEDDQDVIDSRVAAATLSHGIDQEAIERTLFAASAVGSDFHIAHVDESGAAPFPPGVQWLREAIRQHAIDVVVMDPLQDLSRADESNEAMRTVGRVLRDIAVSEDVAVGLVHHTRKGGPGTGKSAEDMRGGSALRGISRVTRMLSAMTTEEAKKAGVAESDHWRYFRVSAYEATHLAPGAAAAQWFEKETARLPSGAEVVAVKTWTWPANATDLPDDEVLRGLRALEAVQPEFRRESAVAHHWAGRVVANALGWPDPKTDAPTKARLERLLSEWRRRGFLGTEQCTWQKQQKAAVKVLGYPWPDQVPDEATDPESEAEQ